MYKQPENNNRVKYMKSKFENLNVPIKTSDKVKATTKQSDKITRPQHCNKSNEKLKYGNDMYNNNTYKYTEIKISNNSKMPLLRNHDKNELGVDENNLNSPPPLNLTRQLSDPSKKGFIKRSPAFRKDKVVNNRVKVESNDLNLDDKIKLFEEKSDICDTVNSNKKDEEVKTENQLTVNAHDKNYDNSASKSKLVPKLSLDLDKQIKHSAHEQLKKSLSSKHTFELESQILRNKKFQMKVVTTQDSSAVKRKSLELMKEVLDNQTKRDLMTAKKDKQTKVISNNEIVSESTSVTSSGVTKPIPEYAQVIKPKKRDTVELLNPGIQLTDSLRAALKQPLPLGPPPQKPPRVFMKSPTPTNKPNNVSPKVKGTVKKNQTVDAVKVKSDPKIMLQKLENALLNNRIRSPKLPTKIKNSPNPLKKQQASQSTFYPNALPCEPNIYTTNTQRDLFPGCLPSLNCMSSSTLHTYAKIDAATDKKSTFFIDCNRKSAEPIYAEPYEPSPYDECISSDAPTIPLKRDVLLKNNLKSVHYMSNPVCDQLWTEQSDSDKCVESDAQHAGCSSKEGDEKFSEILTKDQYHIIMNNTYSAPTPPDSDVDSLVCTPTDDEESHLNKRKSIKDIVSSFEQRLREAEDQNNVPINVSDNNLRNSENDLNLSDDCNVSDSELKMKVKAEISRTVTEIRKDYVRRVCSTMKKPRYKFCDDSPHLFECCFLVGLNVNSETPKPYIKNKFPSNFEVPPHVELLCFPDASHWTLSSAQNSQCFSVVITNEKGERKFGYCRRVLPEEAAFCLPLTYCILSSVRACGFFQKVLLELESRHGLPHGLQNAFLHKLYHSKFPKAGDVLHVTCTLRSLVIDSCQTMLCKDNFESNDDRLIDSIYHLHHSSCTEKKERKDSEKSDIIDWVLLDDTEMVHDSNDEKNHFQTPKNTYGVLNKVTNDSNMESFNKINRYSKEFQRALSSSTLNKMDSNIQAEIKSKQIDNNELNIKLNNNCLTKSQNQKISNVNTKQICECRAQNIVSELRESQYNSLLLNLPDSQLIHDCLLGDVDIKRPIDNRLEDDDLIVLFETVSEAVLLQIFGSLLHERKVIFVSSSLSKLSSCIEALESMLYPFSWQHTFVPVLPSDMLEVLTTPVPLIAGVLAYHLSEELIIEEGIAINLDNNELLCCVGDESTILPKRLRNGLSVSLQLVRSGSISQDASRNVLISEAFIRMFVEVCGPYKHFINVDEKGLRIFKKNSFVKHHSSKSIKLFLEWFVETSMFNYFINCRLENEMQDCSFDKRADVFLMPYRYKGIKKVLKLW